MRLFISACEISSDRHGAKLLTALRELLQSQFPEKSIEAFGIGGPKLRACGLKTLVRSEDLLAMGSTEVLVRISKIWGALRKISAELKRNPPDLGVVIDYPDFHFQLVKRMKKIPWIYYIPPKVWVWRKSRLKFLKKYFSKILCIFPFEEKFYRDAHVMQARYVGNPLMEELPFELTKAQARVALDLKNEDVVVTLMPGSRPAEIKNHLAPMLKAAEGVSLELQKKMIVLIPWVEGQHSNLAEVLGGAPVSSFFVVKSFIGRAHECLVASDAALIKSGTSTLEAALLGCPHVLLYKPSRLTFFIFKRLMSYSGPVGLANILLGRSIVKEILGPEVRAEVLQKELLALLLSENLEMKKSFYELKGLLASEKSPSFLAAEEILGVWGTAG